MATFIDGCKLVKGAQPTKYKIARVFLYKFFVIFIEDLLLHEKLELQNIQINTVMSFF